MGVSQGSGVSLVNTITPGQINGIIMPNRNAFAFLGDSRLAALFSNSGLYPSLGYVKAAHFFNVANSLLGGRMKITYCSATSGQRSDQYLTALPDAIASGAGWLMIHGVVNDIAQYVAQGDTALSIFNRVKAAAQTARNAGMNVIIVGEPGATNITAGTMTGMVHEFNERVREYCEVTPGVYYFDLPSVVIDPTSGAAAIAFLSGYAYDTTHLDGKGHWYVGNAFATFIDSFIPPLPFSIYSANEVASNGNLQQVANPLFITTTGGTSGTGITGSTPASFTSGRGGSATATISTAADANGFGNAVTFACTFTAQGEYINFEQGTTLGNYTIPGDIVDNGVTVSVASGSVNLGGVYLNTNFGTIANPYADGFPIQGVSTPTALPSVAMNNLFLHSVPLVMPAGVNWAFWALRIVAAGAGSATVTISRPWMRRRFAI